MTGEELSELLGDCPVLYHMAERGSWPSIQRHGLLSTSALLELFTVDDEARAVIEARRRPKAVVLDHPELGRAVVRDQGPMDDRGLRQCLQDGLTPEDWYRILNARVFFWLTRSRLIRLLTARPYRDQDHDVLEVDAAALVRAYMSRVTLSPINSGATKPFPTSRGKGTFLPISEYPYAAWRTKRPTGERAVELAVTGGVPDIRRFVNRVSVMRGTEVLVTMHDEG